MKIGEANGETLAIIRREIVPCNLIDNCTTDCFMKIIIRFNWMAKMITTERLCKLLSFFPNVKLHSRKVNQVGICLKESGVFDLIEVEFCKTETSKSNKHNNNIVLTVPTVY